MSVVIQIYRICFTFLRIGIIRAFNVKPQYYCVVVTRGRHFRIIFRGLFKPSQPVETFSVALQGNQAKALRKDFVVYDRRIFVYENKFNGKRRYFGK